MGLWRGRGELTFMSWTCRRLVLRDALRFDLVGLAFGAILAVNTRVL
jgi:hypothetical protein